MDSIINIQSIIMTWLKDGSTDSNVSEKIRNGDVYKKDAYKEENINLLHVQTNIGCIFSYVLLLP